MNTLLDVYLSGIAKKRGLFDTDIARHQEIIRVLWNYAWAVSRLEPTDFDGNVTLCSDIIAKAFDAIESVDALSLTEDIWNPVEKGTC